MRSPPISGDMRAREAFAFLAIGLLVISSFYIVYIGSIETAQRHADLKMLNIRYGFGRADDAETSIEDLIARTHAEAFVTSERTLLSGGEGRLHTIMEMEISGILPGRIEDLLKNLNTTTDNLIFSRGELVIEVFPVLAGIDSPVPWTSDDRPNGTGPSDEGIRCESLGTRTKVTCSILISDPYGSLRINREVSYQEERASLSDLLKSREQRVNDALLGGELQRTANYILSAMAQQKALMGYGRGLDTASGRFYGDILTRDEIISYVELAITLTIQGHLRDIDGSFLGNISDNISASQGAGGETMDLESVLRNTEGAYDPASLVLVGEGIGSEGNPPSLVDMVRPLLYSAVDQLVVKLLSYFGLYDMFMEKLGGLSSLMKTAGNLINSASSTILGKDIIKMGEETAEDILIGPLIDAGLEEEGSLTVMRESFPDEFTYDGGAITGYPAVEVPSFTTVVELHLTDNSSERIYLQDEDGQVFLKGDDPDRVGTYYANRCDVYRVEFESSMDPMVPSFRPVDLMQEEDFRKQLVLYLGDSSLIKDKEERVRLEGEMVLREAVDRAIDILSGVDGLWGELYQGWNETTLSIDDDLPPISRYINGSMGPLRELLGLFTSEALEIIKDASLLSLIDGMDEGIGSDMTDWIYGVYGLFTDREGELDRVSGELLISYLTGCVIPEISWELTGRSKLPWDRCTFPEGGAEDIISVLEDRDLLMDRVDQDGLLDLIGPAVEDSLDIIREREFAPVSENSTGGGVLTRAILGLTDQETRGEVFEMVEGAQEDMEALFFDLIEGTLRSIENCAIAPLRVLGTRTFMPPPCDGTIRPRSWDGEGINFGSINAKTWMCREGEPEASVTCSHGNISQEISEVEPRYRSYMNVRFESGYSLFYSLEGTPLTVTESSWTVNITLDLDLEISTSWPLHHFSYSEGPTLLDDALDAAGEITRKALETIASSSTDLLGGSMSSLSELPPLVVDMAEGKDLDLAEVSRVLTNISMDLSQTAREGVKEMIRSIVEEGISTAVLAGADALNIKEVEERVAIGGAEIIFRSEISALKGEEGALLNLDMTMDSLGVVLHLSLDRVSNESIVFNCTMGIEIGPVCIHIELDPLMDEHPYMISIGAVVRREGEDIRIAIQCPELVRFRTLEVSLSSILGMAPQVPIPPLGISAFIDAGFQLRYMMPTDLGPHINEVGFDAFGNVTSVEIYNPTSLGISGSSVEIRDLNGYAIGSWRIQGSGEEYGIISLSDDNLLNWFGGGEGLVILLRSPSGEIWDRADIDSVEGGWFSRDMDGFGVFRWGEGSPGVANGGGVFSLSSLIISILTSSISEAWKEAYSLYGLSFNCLVHLVQRGIELFVERVVSAIRELVIEVRMFMELKVSNAGTGTAGVGLQLAFIAEGEAFARFLQWVYENIVSLIENIKNPQGSFSLSSFPLDILAYCHIEMRLFAEVEMPSALAKMVPDSAQLPDSLNLGIVGRFNLALPLRLMGVDVGPWKVSMGVVVLEPPLALVSFFYDVPPGVSCELWLLKATIWSE